MIRVNCLKICARKSRSCNSFRNPLPSFVAILSAVSVAIFVPVMNVLKYFFNIDPSRKELERLQEEQRHRVIAVRFLSMSRTENERKPLSKK